jgi:hypothetical protein
MFMRILNFIRDFFRPDEKKEEKEIARKNMKENFLNDHAKQPKMEDFIDRKKQSMLDSQGVSDFTGSGYHGPGSIDREKRNSNMNQTNY